MARHLDRDVHRFRLDPEEGDGLFGLLQTCINHADGPVTSFSDILFYKLMESALAGITVVLTDRAQTRPFAAIANTDSGNQTIV